VFGVYGLLLNMFTRVLIQKTELQYKRGLIRHHTRATQIHMCGLISFHNRKLPNTVSRTACTHAASTLNA
jgi:hypothetical protein